MMGGGVEDRRTIELNVNRPADHDGATPDARNRTATKLWTISSSTNYVAVSSISAVAVKSAVAQLISADILPATDSTAEIEINNSSDMQQVTRNDILSLKQIQQSETFLALASTDQGRGGRGQDSDDASLQNRPVADKLYRMIASRATDLPSKSLNSVAAISAISTEDIIAYRAAFPPGPSPLPGGDAVLIRDVGGRQKWQVTQEKPLATGS
ncbi:hypothetical protein THAOC_20364 [Thalassiosira oceanica]|uniref:Uncharacterized protein n=1 Tax=Thalassiosira oceanica TaxID=159749 RepID=K0S3I5_THAOC|nr:hypothetical protein THAOC_20364 [Thalassiosira oceanica]|eukprot:EJK59419.1 hypothetical protein THAOC_20364 [Thalassiosira oceanica]